MQRFRHAIMNKTNAILRSQASDALLLALLIFSLAMAVAGVYAAPNNMDIDYSHSVKGTGTVMTDFKMWSAESTLATGRVRGSGEVMNKYIFVSNNSENVSIQDHFLFTEVPAPHKITIRDYPQMTGNPGSFRLLGTIWAANIKLVPQDYRQNSS